MPSWRFVSRNPRSRAWPRSWEDQEFSLPSGPILWRRRHPSTRIEERQTFAGKDEAIWNIPGRNTAPGRCPRAKSCRMVSLVVSLRANGWRLGLRRLQVRIIIGRTSELFALDAKLDVHRHRNRAADNAAHGLW